MKLSGTKPGTWRRGVFLGVIVGMLLGACGKPISLAEEPSPWTAILDFRRLAVVDYPRALETYALPMAREKFKDLDVRVWPMSNSKLAWSYFLDLAVVAGKPLRGDALVAAFYHPWSDVFLLTHWSQQSGKWKLTDAEAVGGETLRAGARAESSTLPAWVRSDLYKPVALGLITADSIRAFEALKFETEGADWRAALPWLREVKAVEEQQTEAAVLLIQSLALLDGYRQPREKEDARLPALRQQTTAALELAKAGSLKQLLDLASGTLPETREFLLALPAEHFATWDVGAVLLGPKAAFVFLAPANQAGYFVGLLFSGEGSVRIDRMDAIHYGAMYDLSTLLAEHGGTKP